MTTLRIFDLASQHAKWLSARQAVIAGNVANANTPGFRAADVEPFSAALDSTRLAMTATSSAHIDDQRALAPRIEAGRADVWETQHSGNSVSLEQEMLKAGEVKGAFTLDAAIVKAFNRMLLVSAKG